MSNLTIEQAMQLAIGHFNAGHAVEAEVICRQLIAVQPACAQAISLLGVLACQTGRLDEAVELLQRAAVLEPAAPQFHSNLGEACRLSGRFEQAVSSHRRAIELRPDYGVAYDNLGLAWFDQGQNAQAIVQFRKAIELMPGNASAHNNLGAALAKTGLLDEALAAYQQAITLEPAFFEAYNNLGNTLKDLGRTDDALAAYRRAIDLQPHFVEALANLGKLLGDIGRLDEALAVCQRAIECRPDSAVAHTALGSVLKDAGRLDEALAAYKHAVSLDPADPSIHYFHALALLQAGHYKHGWLEHEWRLQHRAFPSRPFKQPRWDGSNFAGQTMLLHTEQGQGDAIQFIRYAPLIKARGGTVILECPSALTAILATCPGIDQVVVRDEPLPAFDVHLPIMSAPLVFQTTLDAIPAAVPYLRPDVERLRHWQHVVDGRAEGRLKVGISWQGNPQFPFDRYRSVSLDQFKPLAGVPGITLFSLQRGPGTEQLDRLAQPLGVLELVRRAATSPQDWMDTAELMQSMDLVISVCTANAHMAGALGVRLWVLLGASADWRWLRDRSDSPWYPTARLFRCQTVGNWKPLFEEVAGILAGYVDKKRRV